MADNNLKGRIEQLKREASMDYMNHFVDGHIKKDKSSIEDPKHNVRYLNDPVPVVKTNVDKYVEIK
jgi:hypothetical protein